MSLYYPMTKHTDEEIEILAGMWVEDFENISADVFIDSCKLHRRASQFFPTGKDVLDRCADVWAERQRNIKKLPEPIPDLTPEQIKENADRARGVIKNIKLPEVKKKKPREKRIAELRQQADMIKNCDKKA